MVQRWFFSLLLCASGVLVLIAYADRTVAAFAHHCVMLRQFLHNPLMELPWLQGAALLLLILGRSQQSSTSLRAGIATLAGWLTNAGVLKPLFGRAIPWLYFAHHQYGFRPFHHSSLLGSFPSGHAVLGAALLTVLWRPYPRLRVIGIGALAILGLALIFGEYHYLSDLVAGGWVGVTAGLLTTAVSAGLRAEQSEVLSFLPDGAFSNWTELAAEDDARTGFEASHSSTRTNEIAVALGLHNRAN